MPRVAPFSRAIVQCRFGAQQSPSAIEGPGFTLVKMGRERVSISRVERKKVKTPP